MLAYTDHSEQENGQSRVSHVIHTVNLFYHQHTCYCTVNAGIRKSLDLININFSDILNHFVWAETTHSKKKIAKFLKRILERSS